MPQQIMAISSKYHYSTNISKDCPQNTSRDNIQNTSIKKLLKHQSWKT